MSLRRRSAPTSCGRARATYQAAVGQGHHRRGDRFGIDTRHAAFAQPGARERGLHRRRRPGPLRPRDARGVAHRGAAGQRGGDGRLPGHRLRRVSRQPAGARRRRVRDGEQRDRGDRLGDRAPEPVQHPDHQPVARRAGDAAVPRRSAVRGGGAGDARGDSGGGGGGQPRADARTGCRSSGSSRRRATARMR